MPWLFVSFAVVEPMHLHGNFMLPKPMIYRMYLSTASGELKERG